MASEEEPFDPLPAIRARIDQALASAPDVARAVRTWYECFLDQGFTEEQALYLAASQLVSDPGSPPS